MENRMKFCLTALLATTSLLAGEAALLDSMDEMSFRDAKEKGKAELVEGKTGKAVKFNFENECRNAFITGKIRGTPEWDNAGGISFWVKGDGSQNLGGIQFIWNEDYAVRYDYAFPIDSTEWKKISVPWRDFTCVLYPPNAKPLDPKNGNAPSKLGPVWVGKWWYWKNYAAHSYAIDDVRLESSIELDTNEYKPAGSPLERVAAKLKAGKPVTIVTMGDSLTDYAHWANKPVNWPTLLKTKLAEKYKSEVTIVNPALGGTLLLNGTVLIPRWAIPTPEPDLVTIAYAFNDFESGARAESFLAAQKNAIDRVRRATKGKSDVLVMTSCPAVEKWETLNEIAEAARKASADRKTGLADTYAAFHAEGKTDKEKLFCTDKVHMGPAGHELIAKTVLEALEK